MGLRADLKNAVRTVVSLFAFMLWLMMVFAGLASTTTKSQIPFFVGWILLAVALLISYLTMQQWIKALPGLLGYGVLNGIIMMSTGHLVNNSSHPVPLSESTVMTIFAAGSAVFASKIASRQLTRVDRAALVGVVLSVLLGIANDNYTVWCFVCVFGLLGIAANWHRVERR